MASVYLLPNKVISSENTIRYRLCIDPRNLYNEMSTQELRENTNIYSNYHSADHPIM